MKRLLRIIVGLSVGFTLYVVGLLAWRPWHRRWGATDDEILKPLPGDELVPAGQKPACVHAITIHAPRAAVWRWLVQIGQDRGGFYSYTIFENMFRADMHNADRIVPQWQELRAGDRVRLASKKVYGDMPLLRVAAIEANHYLVLEGWGSFVLEEVNTNTTRFIIRSHGSGNPLGGRLLNTLFWEPAHFIMERGMLRGIKKQAERTAA